jgi:Restriction endonuclease
MTSSAAFQSGYDFEREVATLYRALGAKVEQQVALAGNQVDILVTETTPAGQRLRTAVECKAYARPISVDVVNSFGAIVYLLKHRSLVDAAALVSRGGFTPAARTAANEHGLQLFEISDLRQRIRGNEGAVAAAAAEVDRNYKAREQSTTSRASHIFVIMPFSQEFDDVYLLGIREVAEKLGLVVERADDIEHNDDILGIITNRIDTSDLVIADITGCNPNVIYEVGFSHGRRKPTILLARAGESPPFNLSTQNLLVYHTIVDLRDALTRRLRATVTDAS